MAAVVFGVVWALAAGVTIEPLAIPAAVPIEAAAGLLGMLIVIIAALWRSRQQDESTADSATETDDGLPESDDEVQSPQPQQPGEETTQELHDTEVDTSKWANINNGDTEVEAESAGQNDTSRRTEGTETPERTDRNTSRQSDSNNGGSTTSNSSRRNIHEDDTQSPNDTDNGDLPQEYQREKASFNAGNPETDK